MLPSNELISGNLLSRWVSGVTTGFQIEAFGRDHASIVVVGLELEESRGVV